MALELVSAATIRMQRAHHLLLEPSGPGTALVLTHSCQCSGLFHQVVSFVTLPSSLASPALTTSILKNVFTLPP